MPHKQHGGEPTGNKICSESVCVCDMCEADKEKSRKSPLSYVTQQTKREKKVKQHHLNLLDKPELQNLEQTKQQRSCRNI